MFFSVCNRDKQILDFYNSSSRFCYLCPASVTHKNPQRHKIVYEIRPVACVQTPTPLSKNRRRGPVFTEGRGGGVCTQAIRPVGRKERSIDLKIFW